LLAGTGLGLLVVGTGGLPAISRGRLLGTSLGCRGSGSSCRSGLRSRGSSLRSSRGGGGGSGGSGSGSGSGSGANLGGNGGPRLGDGWGSGNRLLLNGSLLLGDRRGLRSQRLLLHNLGDDSRNGSLILLGKGAVGLRGSLSGLLGLTIGLLLKLLVNLVDRSLVSHLSILDGGGRGRLGLFGSLNSRGSLSLLNDLILFLHQITEDVVQHVVAVRLLSQNKGLDELARGLRLVGDLTDDGNQDVIKGRLGVNVENADLAVLEVELLDLIVDGLS